MKEDTRPILVTGATGYVGRRLLPLLLERGYRVRAAARSLEKLQSRPWGNHPSLELVRVDALDKEALRRAAAGCRAAYWLVHSMNPQSHDFAATDRQAARHMIAAADAAGLEQIIYLTGLGEEDVSLSHHLRSRAEVETILRTGKTPVTSLRAAMIIGSGSASFEILRYLVERLPVMIAPRWVDTPCQPVAIRNVLVYLAGVLEASELQGFSLDIGQEQVLTYRQLMDLYAQEAGLAPRLIIGVPVLTPRLSSYWIHLVTPVPASIARPLAEGLRNTVICRDDRIRHAIPQPLLSCRQAIHLALQKHKDLSVDSHWSDAGKLPDVERIQPGEPVWAGGTVYRDDRAIQLSASSEQVWEAVVRLGGQTGWYYANWLWKIRGWMDRLLGGVGLSRGRRDPDDLHPGDALDFWRVLEVVPQQKLVLASEMILPGEAMLTFDLVPRDQGIELQQRARFFPRGILGLLYWASVTPLHNLVFDGMLKGIGQASHAISSSEPFRIKEGIH